VNSVIVSSDSLLIGVTPPFASEAGDSLQYRVSYWENATSTAKKVRILSSLFCWQCLCDYEIWGSVSWQNSRNGGRKLSFFPL